MTAPATDDPQKFSILYVDDEQQSLKYFKKVFGKRFNVITAPDAQAAFGILTERHEEIAMVIADQRMPGEKGVQFLARTRDLQPRIIRILATAYMDVEPLIEAVNVAKIHHYVCKPWDVSDLERLLNRGLESYESGKGNNGDDAGQTLGDGNGKLADEVLQAVNILMTGMGHHIFNSMVPIKTFLDLIPERLKTPDDPKSEETADHGQHLEHVYHDAVSEVSRIVELIRTVRNAAEHRLDLGRDEVDVHAVVSEFIDTYATPDGTAAMSLVNDVPTTLPNVRMEADQLQWVCDALLDEIVRSAPGTHGVNFSARESDDSTDGARKNVHVDIYVSDTLAANGDAAWMTFPLAISEKWSIEWDIKLYVCSAIIYQHGGQLQVEKNQGAVRCFRITLPTVSGSALKAS